MSNEDKKLNKNQNSSALKKDSVPVALIEASVRFEFCFKIGMPVCKSSSELIA